MKKSDMKRKYLGWIAKYLNFSDFSYRKKVYILCIFKKFPRESLFLFLRNQSSDIKVTHTVETTTKFSFQRCAAQICPLSRFVTIVKNVSAFFFWTDSTAFQHLILFNFYFEKWDTLIGHLRSSSRLEMSWKPLCTTWDPHHRNFWLTSNFVHLDLWTSI